MARPYANDLRRKFLQAYEQGKGTLGELAEQFGVSEGWGKKISSARTRTGQIERPAWRRGPVSRVTPAVHAAEEREGAAGLALPRGRLVLARTADGTSSKKNPPHAQEQATPEAQQRR